METNLKQLTQLDQILTTAATYTHSEVAAKQLIASPLVNELAAVSYTHLTLPTKA